ncbi:TIGR01777 family oxidoreductase [Thalassomonas sp. M1454]|uniref:TIGR01777 family oxidoreductase n=1 Tax=Thalassomonas sp. M1454 TaxID=2594477 RepID=UPI001180C0FE|nr:TIGR01777 family oxidoreductase [Thalassomonas sp. M1454]TRX56604.1 TIGR01777 family protein [Thalassomonas sp. M1454]
MNILITGGTGLIGSAFINKYQHKYHFDILSRQPVDLGCYFEDKSNLSWLTDLKQLKDVNKYDAVINLAGEPIVNKRWNLEQKRAICQSRWKITSTLSKLINDSSTPPNAFISGSAIGYYGRQGSEKIDESFDDFYPEFSHKICKVWEEKASLAQEKTRVCIMRTGIVLDKDQGALKKMLPAYKFGLGGRLSHGNQYMSWIHIDDMVAAIEFLLTQSSCQGHYNLTAPVPVTNREFSKTLASTLRRPNIATMPAFALRLLLGEMSDLLLFGQRVIPKNLLEQDFKFTYPELNIALVNLLNK